MVNIVFIKKIEEIRELADDRKTDSDKAEKDDYKKLNGNAIFYGGFWF